MQALKDVGLDPETRFRYPHEFSGGQRQRIAIARAVVLEPKFVVLDEPTSALDMLIQSQIVDLLRDLQKRRTLTYLFISHDLRVVAALASRVIVMRNGKVVEEGPAQQLFSNPKSRLYAGPVRGRLQPGYRADGRYGSIAMIRIVLLAALALSAPRVAHAQGALPRYPLTAEDGSPILNSKIKSDELAAVEQLPGAVVVGNPQGDVTLAEFYDLNCPFCRRASADVEQLIKSDPKLRVILVPFPVLGIRLGACRSRRACRGKIDSA